MSTNGMSGLPTLVLDQALETQNIKICIKGNMILLDCR